MKNLILTGSPSILFSGRCVPEGRASSGLRRGWGLACALLAVVVGIFLSGTAGAAEPVPFFFNNDTGLSSSQIFLQFLGQTSTVDGYYNNVFGTNQSLQANTSYSLDQLTDPTTGKASVYVNDFNGRIYVNYGPYGLQGMGAGYTPAAQTSTDPNYATRYQYFEQTVVGQGSGTTVFTDLTYIDFTAISLSMSARYTANGTLNTNVQNYKQTTQNTQLLVNATYAQSGTNTIAPVVSSPFTTTPNPDANPNAIIPFGASTTLPNPDFARVISPQFSTPGVYHDFSAYLGALTGNNTAVRIAGTFVGTGTQPTGTPATQGQTFDFTGTFSGNATTGGITLTATALSGNGHVSWLNQANLANGVGSSATVYIPYASLNSQAGIYGNNGNYTVTVGTGAPVNYVGISNDVWGKVVGDLYSGLSFGYVGSNATFTYNGTTTTIGALASSQWWASGQSNNSTYMPDGSQVLWTNTPAGQSQYFGDVQTNPLFYNGYAASLAPLTPGYGFPFQDRLGNNLLVYNTGDALTSNTHVLLTINPDGTSAIPTGIWRGNATDGQWGTAANWSGSAVPGSNATVQFVGNHTQTVTVDTGSNRTVAGISFNYAAGNFTIANNTITLSGDVVNSSNKAQTINSGLLLSSNSTVTAAFGDLAFGGAIALSNSGAARSLSFSGTQNSTVSGVISDGTAAGGSLVKKGAGTLTLSGNNTFTGGLAHQAGTLVLGSDQAVGSGTLSLGQAASADAILQAAISGRTLSNAIALMGNTTFSGSNGFTFNGPATLTGGNVTQGNSTVMFQAFQVTNSVAVEFGGAIGESVAGSSLAKAGSGNMTFSGNAANTFTGALSVNEGTLDLSKTSGIMAYGGTLAIGDGQGAANSAVVRLFANNQTPATSISVATDGQFDLQSFSTTVGNLTMSGGSITGTGSLAVSNNSTVLFNGTGNSTAGIGAGVSLGNGSVTFITNNNAAATEMSITGPLSGNGSLTKAGSGTLAIIGNNTFSGAVTVAGGILAVSSMNASVSLSNGALNPGGTGTISSIDLRRLYSTTGNGTQGAFAMDLGGNSTSDRISVATTDGINLGNGTVFLFSGSGFTGGSGNCIFTLVSGAGAWQTAPKVETFRFASIDIAGLTGSFSFSGDNLTFNGTAGVTNTWNGGGGDGLWTTGGNWQGGAVPDSGADLVFTGSSPTVDTISNRTTGAITFAAGTSASNIISNTITLGGALTNNSSNTQTIGSNLDINFDRTIAANTGNFALTGNIALSTSAALPGTLTFSGNGSTSVSGAISDGPATGGSLVKTGDGTLTLTGNNTFTGSLTISGGTVAANSSEALGNSLTFTTNTLILDGGTLQAIGNINAGAPVTRTVQLLGNGTFDTNGYAVTIGGPIEGAGNLIKAGAGNLTLTMGGANNNSYSGKTIVQGGILNVGYAGALGTMAGGAFVESGASLVIAETFNVEGEALTLSGTGAGGMGALCLVAGASGEQSTWNGTIALSGDALIQVGNLSALTLSQAVSLNGHVLTLGGDTASANPTAILTGALSGAGGLTKAGNGTVNLSGNGTGYTGATTVQNGVLNLLGATSLGNGTSALTVGSGGTLQIGISSPSAQQISFSSLSLNGTGVVVASNNQGAINNSTGNATTIAGSVTLAGDTLINSTTGQLILSGPIDIGSYTLTTASKSAPIILSGNITGTGGISTNSTGGGLVLSGANSYDGATTIVSNSFLTAANSNALGSGAGNTTVNNNASLNLQGGIIIGAESLSLNGTGINTTGALRNLSGNNTYGGTIALIGPTMIVSANGTLAISSDFAIGQTLQLQTDMASAGITLSGNLSGSSSPQVQGSGVVTVSGNASAYTGTFEVLGGTLASGSMTAGTVTLNPMSGFGSGISIFSPGSVNHIETVQLKNLISSGNSQLLFDLGAAAAADQITTTFAPSLAAGISFFFNDCGFSGSGNYTLVSGGGNIGGSFSVDQIAFNTNIANLSGVFSMPDGRTINFQAFNGPAVWDVGSGEWSTAANWLLGGVAATAVPAGGSAVTFNGTSAASVNTVSNRIVGAMAFGPGAGAFTLSNNTITLQGNVTNSSSNIQTINSALALAGNITVSASSANIALGGNLSLSDGSTPHVLTFAGGNSTTVSGVISNGGASSGTLVKTGAGTLTLAGNNTFTGSTSITAGTLVLNGSLAAGNNLVVGANGTLAGTGTASGVVTVAGTLSPGNSPGTLSTGAELWQDGGNYNWQIFNANEGVGSYDKVAITGGLDLTDLSAAGFSINLWSLSAVGPDVSGNALNFVSTNDYSWTIVSTTTGITGFSADRFTVFTGAHNGADGFSNSFGGSFSVGLSGKNLQLNYSAIPEPVTCALLAGSALGLALLRRRAGRR